MAIAITYNSAGNLLASQSLAASASVTSGDIDASAKYGLLVVIKNTPGGTIASTRGLKIEATAGYGASGTAAYSTLGAVNSVLPSATASTAESIEIRLPSGHWKIKLTNLDATNAVTIEVTTATIDTV